MTGGEPQASKITEILNMLGGEEELQALCVYALPADSTLPTAHLSTPLSSPKISTKPSGKPSGDIEVGLNPPSLLTRKRSRSPEPDVGGGVVRGGLPGVDPEAGTLDPNTTLDLEGGSQGLQSGFKLPVKLPAVPTRGVAQGVTVRPVSHVAWAVAQ